MSTPRDLLMAYFNLAVMEITYADFENRCRENWGGTYNSDIVQRRMIALEDIAYRQDLLWPKQNHPSLRGKRPVLTMIDGGGEDGSDAAGV